MSSGSHLIQTNRTMIILDPEGFPVNLGHSNNEDSPESAFPVIAYDGENVLPTALGYRSFFGENTLFDIGDLLVSKLVQQVWIFQSVNLSNIFVALCEDGVYLSNGTNEAGKFDWVQVIDLSAGVVPNVRRLWTSCTISNIPFFYQQGQDGFFGLVDLADYADTTVLPVFVGASKTQMWSDTDAGCGILKYVPTFLNMAGQLGCFKAGNRLGMWDSEGAVAWSSATQIYDFKPDTKTFAGVTTFTDVVGNISTIKQHGNGFIIYATKSITLATSQTGSPEKFAGRAIFSDVGALFDIQVAVSQPDTVHFAITSGGLCRITNGAPEIIETEVMDYVRKNNRLYALTVVDSRYLFIHAANEFSIPAPILTVELADSEGNTYTFPKPVNDIPSDFIDYINQYLESINGEGQADFTDVQEPVDTPAAVVPPKALLTPCWTGKKMIHSWNTPPSINSNQVIDLVPVQWPIVSPQNFLTIQCLIPEIDVTPTALIYTTDTEGRFVDKAGAEFATQLTDAFQSVQKVVDGFNLITDQYNALIGTRPVELVARPGFPGINEFGQLNTIFKLEPGYAVTPDTVILDVPKPDILVASATKCAIMYKQATRHDYRIHAEQQFTATLYMDIRLIFSNEGVKFWHNGSNVSYQDPTTFGFMPNHLPITPTQLTAAAQAWKDDPESPAYDVMTALDVGWSPSLEDCENLYVILNFPSYIISTGLSGEQLKDILTEYYVGENGEVDWTISSGETAHAQNPTSGTLNGAFRLPLITETLNCNWYQYGGYPAAPPASILVQATLAKAVRGKMVVGISRTSHGHAQDNRPGEEDQRYSFPEDSVIFGTSGATYSGGYWGSVTVDPSTPAIAGFGEGVTPPYSLSAPDQLNSSLDTVDSALQLAGLTDFYTQCYEDFATKEDWTCTLDTLSITNGFENRSGGPLTIFEAEVSGYGYFGTGGGNFRKTHQRSLFKPCGYSDSTIYTVAKTPADLNVNPVLPGGDEITPYPPFDWTYPEPIVLPPNYILFQKGSLSPYYQTYKEALVLDLQLQKWGKYSTPHKLVYSLFPINRTDQFIMPIQDMGMRAGALRPNGTCSFFTDQNPASTITYGKIGDYRLGFSTSTKVTAQFARAPQAYAIAEVSLNGDDISEQYSQATEVTTRRAELPFTLAGKWFNIRFEGIFELVNLAYESERSSRR